MKNNGLYPIQNKNLWIAQWQLTDNSLAPTLIFLHEALGSVSLWKDFPEQLCQSLGLNGLCYDRQGHGLSDPMDRKRDKSYLHEEALVYLKGVIDYFNIQHPILIGHSDGGSIALIYAAHFPPTKAVITEAAHIYVEPAGRPGIQTAMQQFKTTSLREKLQKYHGDKTDALFHAWAATWTDPTFADWEIVGLLPQIEAPCLLLQGAEDQYASQQHLFDIAKGIGANAQAVLLDNCGHTPHLQAQKETLDLMADFILLL